MRKERAVKRSVLLLVVSYIYIYTPVVSCGDLIEEFSFSRYGTRRRGDPFLKKKKKKFLSPLLSSWSSSRLNVVKDRSGNYRIAWIPISQSERGKRKSEKILHQFSIISVLTEQRTHAEGRKWKRILMRSQGHIIRGNAPDLPHFVLHTWLPSARHV